MRKTAYFLLPLAGLNTRSFGPEKFIDAYLSPNGEQVIVELLGRVYEATIYPFYKRHWTGPEYFYIEYYIPSRFLDDVKLFLRGKYREMSPEAGMLFNQSVQLFDHGENINEHRIKELVIEIRMSRHLQLHLGFNGRHHIVIAPPELAALAPTHHPMYLNMKTQIEKRVGQELVTGVELLTAPDLEYEQIPKHIYELVKEQCLGYVERSYHETNLWND
jgi:hypothetical protein